MNDLDKRCIYERYLNENEHLGSRWVDFYKDRVKKMGDYKPYEDQSYILPALERCERYIIDNFSNIERANTTVTGTRVTFAGDQPYTDKIGSRVAFIGRVPGYDIGPRVYIEPFVLDTELDMDDNALRKNKYYKYPAIHYKAWDEYEYGHRPRSKVRQHERILNREGVVKIQHDLEELREWWVVMSRQLYRTLDLDI